MLWMPRIHEPQCGFGPRPSPLSATSLVAEHSPRIVSGYRHAQDRRGCSEVVLDRCEQHGIGFIPGFPLADGDLARSHSGLTDIAEWLIATPSQVALAWVLKLFKVMLPIPGTGTVSHLEETSPPQH